MAPRTTSQEASSSEPSLSKVVLGDLRQADFPRTLRQDLRELYSFYFTDERRQELAAMGGIKGIFWFWGWLIKSLLMKLTPHRRLLLVASLVFFMVGQFEMTLGQVRLVMHMHVLGVVLVGLVLMLELKDKLLARDEIEVARQVQLALLPRRHPQPDGWAIWGHTQPANDVGGDLIDYIELGDGRLGVVLGDVAGKGLGAALLMAKLQATLRAAAPDAATPGDLARRLNGILLRDGLDNRFATLFYLELEPRRGALRYLNAGHNPPLLLRKGAAAASPQELSASGPPLGMLAEATFPDGAVEMGPGEMLVLYSDGLTEARNASEEEFGVARLRELAPRLCGLTPMEAGQRLLGAVREFVGEVRLHDDLSLIVLSRSA